MSFAGNINIGVIDKQLVFKALRPDVTIQEVQVREDAQGLIPAAFQHLEVEKRGRGNKGD